MENTKTKEIRQAYLALYPEDGTKKIPAWKMANELNNVRAWKLSKFAATHTGQETDEFAKTLRIY